MKQAIVESQLFRRLELQQLMNLTARAFGVPSERLWTLPCDEALRLYAEFTRDLLLQGADAGQLQRMNAEAYRMGRLLRRLFRLRRPADVEWFTVVLYRHIGIALSGHIPGPLCFRRCFFSRYYLPATCLAASALDDGIMRGLSGADGRLTFSQRLTEDATCCLASFT